MKHKVLKFFIDAKEGSVKLPNSFYISEDAKRIVELEKVGVIEVNPEFKPKSGKGKAKAETEEQVTTEVGENNVTGQGEDSPTD